MLLCLASSLATVVRQACRQKFEFWCFIILYLATCKCFLIFNAVFDIDGLILFSKGDFYRVRCF